MSEEPLKNREVIFEFFTLGAYVKVTAMDVATLTEAITQGPIGTPEPILKQAALQKLAFVMRKKGLIE